MEQRFAVVIKKVYVYKAGFPDVRDSDDWSGPIMQHEVSISQILRDH